MSPVWAYNRNMIQVPDFTPLDPDEDPVQPQAYNTVDLTLDGLDEVDDLQALADEIAEETPDPVKPPLAAMVPAPTGDVTERIIEELEREMEETAAKLHQIEKREAEHMDRHHRLLADFANYRNRTGRDIQMAVDLSERKLLMELVPIIDNFERCIGATYTSLDDCRNGVALIHKQFLDAFRRIGVEGIQTQVGDPFDAQFAEALTTVADPHLPDGAIANVFERGYRLRDQLLRAARVVVNHLPEGSAPAVPSEDDPGNIQ